MNITSSIFDFLKLKFPSLVIDKVREKFYREQLDLSYLEDDNRSSGYEYHRRLGFLSEVLFAKIGMTRNDIYRRWGKPRYNLYFASGGRPSTPVNVLYYTVSLYDTYFLCQFHFTNNRVTFISIKTNGPIASHQVNSTVYLLNRKFSLLKPEFDFEEEIHLHGKLKMMDTKNNKIEIINDPFFRLSFSGSEAEKAGQSIVKKDKMVL